jgi:hypothetical protein
MQDQIGPVAELRRIRDVEGRAVTGVRLRESLGERRSQLPAGARYEDAASLAERIGDVVLQRSRTRGSSQGISCSSGSAGSYSSVTW